MMRRYARLRRAAWFIDPPYTARGGKRAGSRLYAHNHINHAQLFAVAASVAGAVMLTYDDAEEVRELARSQGLQCKSVPMKNTHHAVMRELVITNDPIHSRPRNAIATLIRGEIDAFQGALF